MKTLLGSTLCLALLVASCGGNSGPSCQDVCTKMSGCDANNDMTECLDMCGQFKQVMRSTVYQTLGDCYMDTACAALEANSDMCMAAAMAKIPAGAADRLISGLCTKMVSCDETGTTTKMARLRGRAPRVNAAGHTSHMGTGNHHPRGGIEAPDGSSTRR